MNAPAANYGGGDRLDYLRTQFFVWLHYGRLFFLPVGLTADTDWTLIPHWYDTRVIAGLLFVALLLRVALESRRGRGRSGPWPSASRGSAWRCCRPRASCRWPRCRTSTGCSSRTSGCRWRWSGGCAVAGRSDGPRPGRVCARALGPARVRVALLAVGGNAVGTYERNKVWRSEETLWRDVTEKSPANGRGLMNYGLTQMAQGKYAEAKQLFDRAAGLQPELRHARDQSGHRDRPPGRACGRRVALREGPAAAARRLRLALVLRALAGASRGGRPKRSRICSGPSPEPGGRGRPISAAGRVRARRGGRRS